jgi:hypothetical protein
MLLQKGKGDVNDTTMKGPKQRIDALRLSKNECRIKVVRII